MSKRTFRPQCPPNPPRYPARRRLLAVGAAAALTSLSACRASGSIEGDAVMPDGGAGLDAFSETGAGATPPGTYLPDAGEPYDVADVTGGVAPFPDTGK